MFLQGHLGKIFVSQHQNSENSSVYYRVVVLERRLVLFGDDISFLNGRFFLLNKGAVAFLMDDLCILPMTEYDAHKVVAING